MGLESRSEQPKDPRILAQITLAQMAFGKEDHKKTMAQWLEGGEDSLATHFREYVDAHPDETLHPDDQSEMRDLLEKIRTYH